MANMLDCRCEASECALSLVSGATHDLALSSYFSAAGEV